MPFSCGVGRSAVSVDAVHEARSPVRAMNRHARNEASATERTARKALSRTGLDCSSPRQHWRQSSPKVVDQPWQEGVLMTHTLKMSVRASFHCWDVVRKAWSMRNHVARCPPFSRHPENAGEQNVIQVGRLHINRRLRLLVTPERSHQARVGRAVLNCIFEYVGYIFKDWQAKGI